MAKLNITPSEFLDLIALTLYTKMKDPDFLAGLNNQFDDFFNELLKKPAHPLLQKYWIESDPDMRAWTKRLKSDFENKRENVLRVSGEFNEARTVKEICQRYLT